MRVPASAANTQTIQISADNSESHVPSADPVKGTRADKGEPHNYATVVHCCLMCHVPVPPSDSDIFKNNG